MIEGAWPYVWASYALTVAILGALTLSVALRLRYWRKRARELDADKKEEDR